MASQKETSFEKRSQDAKRLCAKYPDRVPVICERAPRSTLPDIERNKFLVPGTMTCGEFKYVVHKNISQNVAESLSADQTVYLFVGSIAPKTTSLMSEIYDRHKANDGFLYVAYNSENTLGGN